MSGLCASGDWGLLHEEERHAFAGAEYAQVLRMLGNGRLEAMCIDGVKRLCHIRGKMRKKVWVNTVRMFSSSHWASICLLELC